MTIGRRGFLLAGGAVAGAGVMPVSDAMAAPVTGGRSVTDFGVEPNKNTDQKAPLQKAVTEICNSGNAVYIPAGTYLLSDSIELPPVCTILGDPGLTRLTPMRIGGWILESHKNQSLYLSGLALEGRGTKNDRLDQPTNLLNIKDGVVGITNCHFANIPGRAVHATGASGFVHSCRFIDCNSGGLTLSDVSGEGVTILANTILRCDIGIVLSGNGVVSGNYISKAQNYGLKLGSAKGNGAIVAQGNVLQDCRIGIGVSSSGDDIFASLNMIKGAKDGAIRAFDGDKLVGPDLYQKSAESYLNLTVAGNVVR